SRLAPSQLVLLGGGPLPSGHPAACRGAPSPRRRRLAPSQLVLLGGGPLPSGHPAACRGAPSPRRRRLAPSQLVLPAAGPCRLPWGPIAPAVVKGAAGRVSSVPYLDHAATTPLRPEALEAMLPFLQGSFGNPSGQHAAARVAKTAVEEAREQVAAALGAQPAEIVFTGGGTEADNLAVKGAARSARDRGIGDGVVTTAVEHHAVLHSCD